MSGQDQIRALVDETARLRLQLAAANQVAAELRAEVAAWRGAVRWVGGGNCYALRIVAPSGYLHELTSMWLDRDGWRAVSYGKMVAGPILDRDTACAKVCEFWGLPVVLP